MLGPLLLKVDTFIINVQDFPPGTTIDTSHPHRPNFRPSDIVLLDASSICDLSSPSLRVFSPKKEKITPEVRLFLSIPLHVVCEHYGLHYHLRHRLTFLPFFRRWKQVQEENRELILALKQEADEAIRILQPIVDKRLEAERLTNGMLKILDLVSGQVS